MTNLRYSITDSTLGGVLVAAGPRGVCAILLGDDPAALRADLARRFPDARLDETAPDALTAQVVALIADPRRAARLPLDPQGTPFQRRVWDALATIAPGETATYGDIARAIGAPRAVRAVAQACGANPLAVVVPCHRVVREGGALSGYRWGVERKRALLAREARG